MPSPSNIQRLRHSPFSSSGLLSPIRSRDLLSPSRLSMRSDRSSGSDFISNGVFIIGIDFGTTYSGVAWCWSGQPDNIELVTRWKSRGYLASDNAKAPTQIYYGHDDLVDRQFWGYDIPSDVKPLSWFKLLLAEQEDLPQEYRSSVKLREARNALREQNKDPVDVVADFLRLIWNHTQDIIIRDRGMPSVAGCQFKIWITVPAIWSTSAQKKMRRAAEQAGILDRRPIGPTDLELVAEPEAAALAVLTDFKGRSDVKRGDVFVVCDAGGGTVDIISYEVIETEPLYFQECVEGKGKMCGAIFIDEAFEKQLKTALGSKWDRISIASRKALINNEWEHGIKRMFDDADREWTVTIPPEAFDTKMPKLHRFDDKKASVRMEQGQLKFERGHIRTFFGAVLPQIRGLIHEQIKAVLDKKRRNPKAVLLVGGLGSCNYLYQCLNEELSPKGIQVLQPAGQRPWTAICRGAVIRGISETTLQASKRAKVVSRVSRDSYGIGFYETYDRRRHIEEDKTWNSKEQKWVAENQMQWYLRRGDDMHHKDPVSFSYYRLMSRPQSKLHISVYHNDDEEPPSRKTDTVTQCFTIAIELQTPYDELPDYVNPDGEVYKRMDYEVYMVATGTKMDWRIMMNGVKLGQQDYTIEDND